MNYPMLPNNNDMLPARPLQSRAEKLMSAFTNGVASPILTYQHTKLSADLTRQGIELHHRLEIEKEKHQHELEMARENHQHALAMEEEKTRREKEKTRQDAMRQMNKLFARGIISKDTYCAFLLANLSTR